MQYDEVLEYVGRWVGQGDSLLARARDKSFEMQSYGVHAVDPTTGRLLELLARTQKPRRVLEVGSGAGYSTLWFLRGMGQKGTVDAIEHEPETVKVMKDVLKEAQLVRRVRIHLGEALQILKGLKGPFGVVFLDADKDDYPNYLDHAIRMTRKGSIILAHNMLWGGSVMQGRRREGAEGIIEYTRRIFQDPRFSSLIVSLGDGLAISYRVA